MNCFVLMLLRVLNKSRGAVGEREAEIEKLWGNPGPPPPSICCDLKWITATLKMMFPWLDVGPWYSQERELKATVLLLRSLSDVQDPNRSQLSFDPKTRFSCRKPHLNHLFAIFSWLFPN